MIYYTIKSFLKVTFNGRKYWIALKSKFKKENSELSDISGQLKQLQNVTG